MKRQMIYIGLLVLSLALFGCSKNIEGDLNELEDIPIEEEEPEVEDIIDEEPEEDLHEGELRSPLTGEWIPEKIAKKRPYAIQFSNYKTVGNQWGLGEADIVYEALVEGGITRLLGVGQQFKGKKIGSIRSSRHYFVSFADEYNPIYIHFGKTKYAVSKLQELNIDNLDGTTGIGNIVFYRDQNIKAPHNAFTSIDGIKAGIKSKGYSKKITQNTKEHYKFHDEVMKLNDGKVANNISLQYSSYMSPYFEYNSIDGLYYRFQFDGAHKDSNNDKQLSFTNVIIQIVDEWDIDKNGYQTMDIEDSSGKGYYITQGSFIPIKWKKKEKDKWMRYYNENGDELKINPGKTFISVFPEKRSESIVISK